jgi:hypothetical protein
MKLALIAALFPLICAAEPASMVRKTELKDAPATDAGTVAEVAENAQVDAGERRGGWILVRTASGQQGWVKMLSLRYGDAAKRGDTGLAQAFTAARTGSSGTQVTTGVRGLDDEKISTAHPNAAELRKLEAFASSGNAAAEFAERASLQRQDVVYPK